MTVIPNEVRDLASRSSGRALYPYARSLVALLLGMTGVASCSMLGRRGPNVDPNLPVPDSFLVRFETTRGPVDVMARKSWAPIGVDHFYTLVVNHYYDNAGF